MIQLVAIGQVADVNPTIPKELNNLLDNVVTFLPMAAVSETGRITIPEERPISEVIKGYRYFEQGDVLLAKITPCMENGKAVFVEDIPHKIGFGSTEFHVIRPSSEIDGRYLFYMLWNPIFRGIAERNMTGTAGQKRVPTDFLKRYKIPLPPLEEQRRIAAILDKADAVRRKRKEAIALTEELLRSAFLDMFGDPVTNPKGWEIASLGDISKVQGGLQVTTKRNTNPLEVPYLRVANVYRDRLVLDEIKFIRVTQQELERTKLQTGDLLIVEGHGNSEEIGRSSVWDSSIPNCTHQNHLIRVKLDLKRAEPTYISAFLNSSGGRRQLTQFGKTTSGLNTISTSNVKATNIMLPPLSEQKKYSELKQNISTYLDSHQMYFYNTNHLFNSLLQRAFRGEL